MRPRGRLIIPDIKTLTRMLTARAGGQVPRVHARINPSFSRLAAVRRAPADRQSAAPAKSDRTNMGDFS